jgi:SAM-dependent methyltransferase
MNTDHHDPKIIRAVETRKTYTLPEIYDIAFDFRDVPAQVDFLLGVAEKYAGRKIGSALELACGPAYHTREMSRRGLVGDGLDWEPAMVDYTRRLVAGEHLRSVIHHGDMRSFRSDRKYDLTYMLMASFAQLLTNQDILDNFACAADLLTDGGIYIICTAHPRDFYGDEKPSVQTTWSMTRGDVTVETSWGGDNQQFDPLTEIDDITVSFTVTTPSGATRYEFPDRYRRCSIMTFQALVQLSGRFEIVDLFGEFDTGMKLTNARECWRFIPILRKIK